MATVYVSHIEWQSKDYQALAKFMTEVFGFKFDAFGEGYMFYDAGEKGVSLGIAEARGSETAGGSPSVYLEVDSIDDSLAKAQKTGGTVSTPKTKIMGNMGWFAFVKGPEGNIIGVHESEKK